MTDAIAEKSTYNGDFRDTIQYRFLRGDVADIERKLAMVYGLVAPDELKAAVGHLSALFGYDARWNDPYHAVVPIVPNHHSLLVDIEGGDLVVWSGWTTGEGTWDEKMAALKILNSRMKATEFTIKVDADEELQHLSRCCLTATPNEQLRFLNEVISDLCSLQRIGTEVSAAVSSNFSAMAYLLDGYDVPINSIW